MQECGMGDGDARLVAEELLCLWGKVWIMLENGSEKVAFYN